jgi:hypothetical protein
MVRTYRPPRDEQSRDMQIVSSYAPDFASDLTDAREAIEAMKIALERGDHMAFQGAYELARLKLARVEAKLPVRGHIEDEHDFYRMLYAKREAREIMQARRRLGRAQSFRLREVAAGIRAKYLLRAMQNRYDVMKVAAVLIGWGKGWQGGLVSAEGAGKVMDADEAWRVAMKRVIGAREEGEGKEKEGGEGAGEMVDPGAELPKFPEFLDNSVKEKDEDEEEER